MALKSERTHKYRGKIGVVRGTASMAEAESKTNDAELFGQLANTVAKNAYETAVAKGAIEATLAADKYKFDTEVKHIQRISPSGREIDYKAKVPLQYKMPPELSGFAGTASYQKFQEQIAKRYLAELEVMTSRIILQEESAAISNNQDQAMFDHNINGILGDIHESLPSDVVNLLKLSEQKLIIERGRVVQNNYNDYIAKEIAHDLTNAVHKTDGMFILSLREKLPNAKTEALEKFKIYLERSKGSPAWQKGEIFKYEKRLDDFKVIWDVIGEHIVNDVNSADADKLLDHVNIKDKLLADISHPVTLSNGQTIGPDSLADVDIRSIRTIREYLNKNGKINSQYITQLRVREAIKKRIDSNPDVTKLASNLGMTIKDLNKAVATDPKILDLLYESFVYKNFDVIDTDETFRERDYFNNADFRAEMFGAGIILPGIRNNIKNVITSNDPSPIIQNMGIIREIIHSGREATVFGFTESEQTILEILAGDHYRSADGSPDGETVLRFIENRRMKQALKGKEELLQRYEDEVREQFGSMANYSEEIIRALDDRLGNFSGDEYYYGPVIEGKVRGALAKKFNQGALINTDTLEDTIELEIAKIMKSGSAALSTRGAIYRKLGEAEDETTVGDFLNPFQHFVPDFIYNADAISRSGIFMFNAPEAHHGDSSEPPSVEYLIPKTTEMVRNHYKKLQEINPDLKMPENIERDIRFVATERGSKFIDFNILLVAPNGDTQTLSDRENGLLTLTHEEIEDIKLEAMRQKLEELDASK
tara:strand:- start:22 stop:2319 length:2298 start_codon:yes stop_codon:yes gene_type:complete